MMHAGLHIFRHGCRLYALKAFIIIVLAATAGVCIAGQPLRIELPAEPNSTPYQVVPLGQKGVLVFYRIADSSTRTGDTWYFRLFDTGLTEKWQRTIKTGDGFRYKETLHRGDTLFLAFIDQQDSKYTSLQLIMLDLGQAHTSSRLFRLPAKSDILQMVNEGDLIYVVSSDKNKTSSISRHNMEDGSSISKTLLEDEESQASHLFQHPEDSSLYLAIRHQLPKGVSRLSLFHISGDCEVINRIPVGEAQDPVLMSASIALGDSNSILLFGNYVLDSGQKPLTQDRNASFKASGLFSAKIRNGITTQVQYHQFFNFHNFFDYLTYEDISRMKKNKKNEKLTIDFGVFSHPMMNSDGVFILLSEAYYPKYEYITRTEYDFYGMPYPYSYSVFEGYQYTNAFIAGFDSLGNKVWDNNFEIRNMLVPDLRQRLSLLFDGPEVVMVYNNEGMIASQVISGYEEYGEFEFSPVEPLYPGDQPSENREGYVKFWYDNFVVCYGYQKVSNPSKGELSKRNVFYINKMAYR